MKLTIFYKTKIKKLKSIILKDIYIILCQVIIYTRYSFGGCRVLRLGGEIYVGGVR